MKFRTTAPKRTCNKKYSNYRKYKSHLRSDFNKRCGYTNCPDFWFGGPSAFHIDHFKPTSKYPELESEYSNLVYCCSYINILKSNDEGGYLDPCDTDYNKHFERDNEGYIYPKKDSKKAAYMYHTLQMYLRRYQIIWLLDELTQRIDKLDDIIDNNKNVSNAIKNAYFDINRKFHKYRRFLSVEQ